MSDYKRPPEKRKRDSEPPKKERTTSSDTRVFSPISESSKPVAAPKRRPASGTVKKSKSNNILFIVTTVFAGVLVCVFAFSLMFKNMLNKDEEDPSATASSTIEITAEPEASPLEVSTASGQIVGVIRSINISSVQLFNPDSSETEALSISNESLLKDKYGNTISASEFSVGDIVDVSYSGGTVSSMKVSSQTVVYPNTSGVDVNTENSTLNIGNKNYTYNSNTIAIYNGSSFDISQLDPVDKVTVNVYQNTVYYIEVLTGHGTIRLTDCDNIIDGTLELNGEIYSFANSTEIKVSAGTYTAKVTGRNIEPFNQQVTINNFDVTTLSLSDVMLKIGVLKVTANVSGAVLTVNEETMNLGELLKLDYGDYTIRVTAEGYNDYEKAVTLDAPELEVPVTLESSIQTATITVYSSTAGARIYVDGDYKGESPVEVTIEHGSHTFTATKEGYLSASQVKTISSDDDNVTLNMQQELLIDETPAASGADSGSGSDSDSAEEASGAEGD